MAATIATVPTALRSPLDAIVNLNVTALPQTEMRVGLFCKVQIVMNSKYF